VNPRASLDDVEKVKFLTLPAFEPRNLGRSARSQSLSRLRILGKGTLFYRLGERYPCSTGNKQSCRTSDDACVVEVLFTADLDCTGNRSGF
jgi:hypothetical protein